MGRKHGAGTWLRSMSAFPNFVFFRVFSRLKTKALSCRSGPQIAPFEQPPYCRWHGRAKLLGTVPGTGMSPLLMQGRRPSKPTMPWCSSTFRSSLPRNDQTACHGPARAVCSACCQGPWRFGRRTPPGLDRSNGSLSVLAAVPWQPFFLCRREGVWVTGSP